MPYTTDMSAGACHAFNVTPSDSTDTPYDFRAISCATAGNVTLTTYGYTKVGGPAGADVTIYCAAGVPIPIAGVRIKATGTTAGNIVAYL